MERKLKRSRRNPRATGCRGFGAPSSAALVAAVAVGLASTLVFDLAKRSDTVQRILGHAALDPHP